ncbi:MAG: discoidin domain-containing protein, partial [Opitutales bacterium]|nr:discoidin domain-containing protein [Opitutales bacterium]
MKSFFKTAFVAAALASPALCLWAADAKSQPRKGSPRFGENYLNIRFSIKEPNRERFDHRDPDAAGVWSYHADDRTPAALCFEGKDGSQLYLKVKVGEGLNESIIYMPSGKAFLTIPAARQVSDDARNEIPKGLTNVKLSPPNYKELSQYRNLALNPYDFQDGVAEADLFYPHITASTECRNELIFRARNAVDGVFDNNLHHGGWKHRSWGPEKEESPWIRIDFGRPVELDKVVLTLRADFPHDGYWESGELAFSGTKKTVPVKFKKTEAPQEFKFPKVKTTFIELRKLKTKKPIGWCALSEFEAWGKDVMPFAKKGKKKLAFSDALSTMPTEGASKVKNLWLWRMLGENFPIEADHLMRDFGTDLSKMPDAPEARAKVFKTLAKKALGEIENKSGTDAIKSEIDRAETLPDAIRAYESAVKKRRLEFLSKLDGKPRKYVYVERYPIAPSFYGYTEAVSDARSEMRFAPDSNLCMLEIKPDGSILRTVLISDKDGTLRDPDISYDGTKILFSWKKSALEDDYHLYEMDISSRKIRQLTTGVNADIEGKYLPTGEIVFNSTRCEQATDCWHTEVSNLYMMKPDGSFLRRVGFDQVCTTYPTVTEQGNVIYTRWDYNDRGQTFTQALFSMKPDGSFQTEVYGNKSWYPTTIGHARQIPNTNKYIATLHGHHTAQRGKLAEIDPSKGRQEDSGVELLAPRRKEKAVRVDGYGQRGEQFQYPFPLAEGLFLVTFQQYDADNRSYPLPYGLYLMDSEGRRELLARHEYLDCKQAVAVAPRKIPQLEKSRVDYAKDKGYLFIRNIYYGAGVEGVEKGSIKKVRVVKLDYRPAAVGGMNGRNNEGG